MALVMERAEADFKSVHAHLLAKSEGGSSKVSLLSAGQCLSLWKEMLECVATLHENGELVTRRELPIYAPSMF